MMNRVGASPLLLKPFISGGLPRNNVKNAFELRDNELLKLESGNGSWYCTNCKVDCGLCSGAVLKDHSAVQCDSYEMWVHNGCSFVTESQYETLQNTKCTWICPKCEFFSIFPICSFIYLFFIFIFFFF